MTTEELETYNNFIQSNSSFCHAINNDTIPSFDYYTTLELIIIFLKCNIEILEKLGLNEVIDFVNGDTRFIVKEMNVYHKSHVFTINYLKKIVYDIKKEQDSLEQSKIIPFPNSVIVEEVPNTNSEYIQIKVPDISSKQRGTIFENTALVTSDTIPYIRETKKTFNDRIFYILDCIFNGKQIEFEFDGDYKLIASMINLFPLTEYINEEEIPYLEFNIPQNLIGLRTAEYDEKEVRAIEDQITKFEREQKRLELVISSLTGVSSDRVIDGLHHSIEEYRRKEFKALFDRYTATHHEYIFNKTLINFIRKAIAMGNVEVNYHYLNPLVRIFYIERNEVKFICRMHLDLFYNIVDNSKYRLEKPHKLEYKNE